MDMADTAEFFRPSSRPLPGGEMSYTKITTVNAGWQALADGGLQPRHSSLWTPSALVFGNGPGALFVELEGAVSLNKWSRIARQAAVAKPVSSPPSRLSARS